MDYIDNKYVGLVGVRLEQFKKKGKNIWNCRCPICGDSEKDKLKTRGYLFEVPEGDVMYKCHNCGTAMGLGHFLKQVDLSLSKQYILDKFGNKKKFKITEEKKDNLDFFMKKSPTQFKRNPLDGLTQLTALASDHPARLYIESRKIPKLNLLYYTDTFQAWTNSVVKDKFINIKRDEPRVVIPFFDVDNNLIAFQGRSLDPKNKMRYITIKVDKNATKLYGMERVDFTEPVYVVEGPIDSLFVDNGIAMAGSDVILSEIGAKEIVVVMDNEPRNVQIVSKIGEHIDKGYSVVVWNSMIEEKDINDMVLAGWGIKEINAFLREHTYKGMRAKIMLNNWKRV
jgi:hypothetical protein